MDLAFSPDGRRLAVASQKQIKLIDTETAEEVLTLRGRAHHCPTHGFNPRVRFSPDGRSLFAICHDDGSRWLCGPAPGRPRRARRGTAWPAVAQSPATSRWPRSSRRDTGRERLIALDHLDHAMRIGLESPEDYLTWARILAGLDQWAGAADLLDRAAAMARPMMRSWPGWPLCSRCAGISAVPESGMPGCRACPLACSPPTGTSMAWRSLLAGDQDRYRQLCVEAVRRLESNQDPGWVPSTVAYTIALGPVSTVDADTRIRIAQRGYDGASSAKDESQRFWARLALGAAHIRAADPARAEPILREAIAKLPDGQFKAIAAAWMAIATWHQGRRDEARSWFARADRFVLERLPGGSIGREYRPPRMWSLATGGACSSRGARPRA